MKHTFFFPLHDWLTQPEDWKEGEDSIESYVQKKLVLIKENNSRLAEFANLLQEENVVDETLDKAMDNFVLSEKPEKDMNLNKLAGNCTICFAV